MKGNSGKIYIGVDVGGTAIKFGIFEGDEKKLVDDFSIETELRKDNNEQALLNDIFSSLEEYCSNNKYGVKKNNIKGIGFAVPGPVVNNQLMQAVNINWKKKIDIVKETKKRFGAKVDVRVLNDANAAAYGEYSKTLKEKYKSIAFITLGTAVGTGVIINGKLIEGKSGIAGELSHIRVDYSKDALKCSCGNVGCIETMAGSRGILNLYNKELKAIAKAKGIKHYNHESAKSIFKKAKAGDKLAYKVVDKSLDYVSNLIAILMHVYEPEVVLIGGGISHAGTFITKIIRKNLKKKIFMTKDLPKIMIAKLKNKAGICGAVEIL